MSLAMWLRAGRATRKLSLDDVAKITKIQPRILEKLESGQLEGLPAEVFVKGFVRSFAKCVGLSEREALERYGAAQSAQSQHPGAATAVAKALVETMSPTVRLVEPSQLKSTPDVIAELSVDAPAEVSVEAPAVEAAPSVAIEAAPAPETTETIEVATAVAVVALPSPAPKRRRTRTTAQTVATETPANPSDVAAEILAAATMSDAVPAVAKKRRSRKKSTTASPQTELATETTTETLVDAAADTTIAARTAKAPRARRSKKTTQAPIVAIAEALVAEVAPIEPVVEADAAEALPETTPFVRPETTEAGEGEAMATATSSDFAAGSATQLATATEHTLDANELAELQDAAMSPMSATSEYELEMSFDSAADAPLAEGSQEMPSSAIELEVGGTWQPTMPPLTTAPTAPWRRPQLSEQTAYVVPTLVIDDADPDSADREREQREKASREHSRLSFLPPILLDREDRSARQGGLTLAVIILLIAATLTLSYLMRRPSPSGDGVTIVDGHAQLFS